jgi:hypothetical protein
LKKVRIGSGGGYAGDRIEPAIEVVEKGEVDAIVFECLAERTIALAQQQKLIDPQKGYNELLEYRMEKILPLCAAEHVTVITNMGAANPTAATEVVKAVASRLGLDQLKIATVLGDDMLDKIERYRDLTLLETGETVQAIASRIISANAYLGVDGIVDALQAGANIVITGRVADPSLFLAPIMFELGWDKDDYARLGQGIVAGHLMECGAQVTGGYFADPGYKDVPELWRVGFPIAEVSENGDVIITKVEDAGGVVTRATCTEQLLYEIHDPARYVTPDAVADFSNVTLQEIAPDQVLVQGATARTKPATLKVSLGYRDGYVGKGEISYGGSGAYARARLAGDIVARRLDDLLVPIQELRIDLIGVNSLYRDSISASIHPALHEVPETRLRVAARTDSVEDARKIGNEVETLYTNGPAGGGGVSKSVAEIVAIGSILIPRDEVQIRVHCEEVWR